MEDHEMIMIALAEIKGELKEGRVAMGNLYGKIESIRVAAATVSTEYEGHVRLCEGRHKNDGTVGKTILVEGVKFITLLILATVALKWGLKI